MTVERDAERPGPREGLAGTPAHRRSEGGFSLVEVLVAVVVLAFGLLTVAGMTLGIAMNTRNAAGMTNQTLAAQQVLEELRLKGYDHADLSDGSTGSETVTVGSRQVDVDYQVVQTGPGLKELRATSEAFGTLSARTYTTLIYESQPAPPLASP